jgi:hypothetical protein
MKRKQIPVSSETASLVYNQSQRTVITEDYPLEDEPVSAVEWIHRSKLKPNDYNPNHVAPPDLELLIQSLLEDGWTQPIVVRKGWIIVDGFHRWTVSGDARMMSRYDGMVPIVWTRPNKFPQLATIRHNRARGVHAIVPMADIVRSLIDQGMTKKQLGIELGMEDEEVVRLLDRAGNPDKLGTGFGKAWAPTEDGAGSRGEKVRERIARPR